MTDESDQTYPFTPNTLLDNALGPLGYYGAFTANMHTDAATIPQSDALLASAHVARGADRQRQADADLARRPQRVLVRRHRLEQQHADASRWRSGPGRTGLTGMVPDGRAERHPADRHQPRRQRRDYHDADDQGPGVRDLHAPRAAPTPRRTAAPGAMAIAALSADTGPAMTDQSASLRWTTSNVATLRGQPGRPSDEADHDEGQAGGDQEARGVGEPD